MSDLVRKRELTRLRTIEYRKRKKSKLVRKLQTQKVCDCCGEPFEEPYSRFVVQDHDHETGEPRGLVCQSCNKRVGMIERGITPATGGKKLYLQYLSKYPRD